MKQLLYIPGLGDDTVTQRQFRYIAWWGKLHHADVTCFDPKWHDIESYTNKWQRLDDMLRELPHDELTIIGVSAGGSLAMRALEMYPNTKRVITVCAKLQGAQSIGTNYRLRAPALHDAVRVSEKIILSGKLPSQKIVTYRSLYDPIVPLKDSVVPGAKKKRLIVIGHALAIVMYLALYLPKK